MSDGPDEKLVAEFRRFARRTSAKDRARGLLADIFESRGVHSDCAAGEAIHDMEMAGIRFVYEDGGE